MRRSSTSADPTRRRTAPPALPQKATPRGVDPHNPLFVGSIAKCFQVLEALNAAGRAVALTELVALAELHEVRGQLHQAADGCFLPVGLPAHGLGILTDQVGIHGVEIRFVHLVARQVDGLHRIDSAVVRP